MNWYLSNGKDSDVVISTRIRYARNIQDYRFNMKRKEEIANLLEKIKEEVPEIGYGLKFFRLKDMDNTTQLSLVEKNIISPEFALKKQETGAILINDEENICIMINEEDHLRIQVISPGLELENTLNLAMETDKKLEKLVSYAFNEKYGFLTSCPTNVGTGLRTSVMVHLPALTKTGNIEKVLEAVNGFNMNIRGMYGEGTKILGDTYQISNKQSLGISEKEIIKNIRIITDKVIEQERLARKILGKQQVELEDMVYRAYGVLTNAKIITSEECNSLLSEVKLGVDLGIIKEINDLNVKKLQTYTKPANLQKYVGQTLDSFTRDIKRAEVIKEIIKE